MHIKFFNHEFNALTLGKFSVVIFVYTFTFLAFFVTKKRDTENHVLFTYVMYRRIKDVTSESETVSKNCGTVCGRLQSLSVAGGWVLCQINSRVHQM